MDQTHICLVHSTLNIQFLGHLCILQILVARNKSHSQTGTLHLKKYVIPSAYLSAYRRWQFPARCDGVILYSVH